MSKRGHMVNLERVMKGPFGDIKLTFKNPAPPWTMICGEDGVWRMYEWVDGKHVERPWPDDVDDEP
jgi:hypothetical protein